MTEQGRRLAVKRRSFRGLPPPQNADATHADWCRMVSAISGYHLVPEGCASHGRRDTP